MILFLYGPDSFRLQQRLNVLKQGFISKYDKSGLNIETIDNENFYLEYFHKIVMSDSLFVKKRMTVIKNVFDGNKEFQEGVAEELDKVDKDHILIFTAVKVPKVKDKNKLFARLKKADKVENFPLLKAGDVYHWIQTEVKNKNAFIENDAVRYLQEAVGNDLWRMHNEIEKLTSFTERITIKEVEIFLDSPLDDNIFDFTDALSNKDARKALKLLHDQIDSGANEFYLLTMLARQIKILLQIKETNGKGLDLHPFVIKKAMPQSNKFSLERLKELFSELTKIDFKLKNSQGSPKLLLDMFVVNMCK